MVVYLDVLIIENFIVNYFLLHITAQTVRIRTKGLWHSLSAFAGSLYVITLLYPKLHLLTTLPFKVAAALAMIMIAFRSINFKFNLKATVIYILYSILLAGMCFFIEMNRSGYSVPSNVIYEFSYKNLLLSLIIAYLLLYRIVVYIKDRKEINKLIYEVNIKTKKSLRSIKAFLDTGNELREPVTNLPVIVADKAILIDMFNEDCDKYSIPFRVLNGQTGSLEAFRPDYIEINLNGKIQKREVIIALAEGKLCSLNEYQALLSRGII